MDRQVWKLDFKNPEAGMEWLCFVPRDIRELCLEGNTNVIYYEREQIRKIFFFSLEDYNQYKQKIEMEYELYLFKWESLTLYIKPTDFLNSWLMFPK